MPAREEIIQTYGRMTPIFLAMEEQGKLEENWVMLRDLQRNPDPLPQPVIDAIIATLGLRCRNAFCFAGHSMGLMFAGATMIDIENLARALALPPVVPEH
ncbi:MAG: hypothetical protein KC431_22330, partial [Myxococcales bacterium]|nr:hypothetical protein [Myxococcales bacterium]